MLPDPPGKVRSNSYDESFLQQPPEASLQVLSPRAMEAPPRLQRRRNLAEVDGPLDAPPTTILTPQSDGMSPRSETDIDSPIEQNLHPRKLEQIQNDVGAEKPSALLIHPSKDGHSSQTTNSAAIADNENAEELPFDEGGSRKLPLDRFYLTGPRVAAPRRIELDDLTKEVAASSRDGAAVQEGGVDQSKEESQGASNKKDDDDDDSLFEFAEKAESPTAASVSDDKAIKGAINDIEEDCLDAPTQGNQTIHSFYSKSAESEVEDLIKDILLIGSSNDSRPGKRKVKQDQSSNNSVSKGTVKNGNHDGAGTTTLAKESDGDDPLTSVWNFLFDAGKSKDELEEPKDSLATTLVTCPSAAGELFDYASELFLGGNSKDSDGGQSGENAADGNDSTRRSRRSAGTANGSYKAVDRPTSIRSAPSLEEDLRLVELAMEAARSIHRMRGCDFDDTYEIDFSEDIKFTVVDLALPLGLIFQEHRIGCWVTRVLPDGSASKIGQIQIGDQLAAIDGTSAINMSVSDVAALVTDKIESVELTFMRYVGPLRPPLGRVTEEGYEVNPGNLLNRGVASPPDSPVRHASLTQQRIESPISMETVTTNPGDRRISETKSLSSESEKRRFRLFGKRNGDK